MTTKPTKKQSHDEEPEAVPAAEQAVPAQAGPLPPRKRQPKRAGCLAGKPSTKLHADAGGGGGKKPKGGGKKTTGGEKKTEHRRETPPKPVRIQRQPAAPEMERVLHGKPTTELHGKPTTALHGKPSTSLHPPKEKKAPSPLAGKPTTRLHAGGQKVEIDLTELLERATSGRRRRKKKGCEGGGGPSSPQKEEKKKKPSTTTKTPSVPLDAFVFEADQNIPEGQVIEAGDLKVVRVPVAQVPADAITDPRDIVGKPAAQNIRKNAVVREGMVAESQRGQPLPA